MTRVTALVVVGGVKTLFQRLAQLSQKVPPGLRGVDGCQDLGENKISFHHFEVKACSLLAFWSAVRMRLACSSRLRLWAVTPSSTWRTTSTILVSSASS